MGMDDKYFLTERDLQQVKMLLESHRGRQLNTRNRPAVPDEQGTAPEVYVAMTPAAGIPAVSMEAMTGSGSGSSPTAGYKPGAAVCKVYQLHDITGVGTDIDIIDTGNDLTVYNIYAIIIPKWTWIIVERDKFGSWLAVPPPAEQVYATLWVGTIYSGIAAGSHTVTPDSMFGIVGGPVVVCSWDADDNFVQEVVIPTASDATTFTATFAYPHTAPISVSPAAHYDNSNVGYASGAFPGMLWKKNPDTPVFGSGATLIPGNVWLFPSNISAWVNGQCLSPFTLYFAQPIGNVRVDPVYGLNGEPAYEVNPFGTFIGCTYAIATQNVPFNGNSTLTFATYGGSGDLVGFDTSAFFRPSLSTSRLWCPAQGFYDVTVSLQFSASSTYVGGEASLALQSDFGQEAIVYGGFPTGSVSATAPLVLQLNIKNIAVTPDVGPTNSWLELIAYQFNGHGSGSISVSGRVQIEYKGPIPSMFSPNGFVIPYVPVGP